MDADLLDSLQLAFTRRKAVEESRQWKIATSAALFGNSRLMDEKGVKVRTEMLDNIEEIYQTRVDIIYGATTEEEIPKDDPLFSNIRSVMDGAEFDDGSGVKEEKDHG